VGGVIGGLSVFADQDIALPALQQLRKFCPTGTPTVVPVSIRKPGFASSTAAPARNDVALEGGFLLEV
jgi:hypothetical protein